MIELDFDNSMLNYIRDHCTYTKSIVILIFSRLHLHDSTFVWTELIIRFLQLSELRITIMLVKVSLDKLSKIYVKCQTLLSNLNLRSIKIKKI